MPDSQLDAQSRSGGNAVEKISKVLTSSIGSLGALAVAVTLAATQFRTLSELPKTVWKNAPDWAGGVVVSAILLLLAIAIVWEWLLQRHMKRCAELGGTLKRGYFTLQPREKEDDFDRADNAHLDTLRWVENSPRSVLYLTGASGTGKSSVLAACVIPKLRAAGHIVIRLRGYQDLCQRIVEEISKPGVVWDRATRSAGDLPALLSRALRNVAPKRIFLIIDQFEEFLILRTEQEQNSFRNFLDKLNANPIDGVVILCVFRSEYEGVIDSQGWPERLLRVNLREIFPFDESAAQDFLIKSERRMDPQLLRSVLRECRGIEAGAAGLIRPITLNLCGLVLKRFANGLPSRFRGGLIREFLRDSISLPETSAAAAKIIPKLMTRDLTRQPRTIDQLALETGLGAISIKACLYRLGREDRGIVRALDPETQNTWEISHDFLVPLLDTVVARWSASLWRRSRPWLPWIATLLFASAIPILLTRDPLQELNDLGWTAHRVGAKWTLDFNGSVSPQTAKAFALLRHTAVTDLTLSGATVRDISSIGDLRNLHSLDLFSTEVKNLSPLKDLRTLTHLKIVNDTELEDVSSLKDLTNLFTLDLSLDKGITNLSALAGLRNLTDLNLSFDAAVSDVSFLKHIPNLVRLNLRGTAVKELSPLKNLHNLKALDLQADKALSGVYYLSDLRNLTQLDLSLTSVNDISPLEGLSNLTRLDLSLDTALSDLSSLAALSKLKQLDLAGTTVTGMHSLKNLRRLALLNLSGTGVSDVSFLKDLHDLSDLDLSLNPALSDVSPLKDLPYLARLNLEGTAVKDLSSLKNLHNLKVTY